MLRVNKYSPSDFESKWAKKWEELGIYKTDFKNAKRPFYNLMMFPYPSAEGLHVGSFFTFSGIDTYGRFKRMRGYEVFEPIGLDAFGIHSENYAIKVNRHPRQQAKISQNNFYRQLHQMGNIFDWDRTVETNEPNYYKWTQWLFIKMFKAGLAYRGEAEVNWCPSCKTVLADEQVVRKTSPQPSLTRRGGQGGEVNRVEGSVSVDVCERCGSEVERRNLEQWFFRIATGKRPDGRSYPDALLDNLSSIDWVEKVKIGQRNWIGKKEGINITYPVIAESAEVGSTFLRTSQTRLSHSIASAQTSGRAQKASLLADSYLIDYITCFTTRPDTNFGATFVVVAPEHPFVASLLNKKLEVRSEKLEETKNYLEKSKKKSEAERIAEGREKTGVFTGFYAINQLNNYKMPIYISDFVLMEFGTGAVVGVPGHDKRDFEFAQKFNLPVIRVVVGKDADRSAITYIDQVQEEEGEMINSGFLDGWEIHKAIGAMMNYLEEKRWGKRVTTYHIRDWLISRQRYWGAPIPMIYCQSCAQEGRGWLSLNKSPKLLKSLKLEDEMPGWYPVNEEDLPVLLPDIEDWRPKGTERGPLAAVPEFYEVACPECGGAARRETDVCDTFLDSSWYFLRYPFTEFYDIPFGSFMFLKEETLGRLKKTEGDERKISFFKLTPEKKKEVSQRAKRWLPVTSYIGGAEHTVLHLLYARWVTMVFHDLGYLEFEEPFSRFYAHGLIIKEGAKMSKSKGNIINPDEYVEKYGADTLRTYLRFIGPFDQGGDFRDTGIAGMYRFLGRVWRVVHEVLSYKSPKLLKSLKENNHLTRIMHRTIKEVTEDLENLRFNTAVAHIMQYVNQIQKSKFKNQNSGEIIETLLLLLAPFAPYMTEELWQRLRRSQINADQNADKRRSALISLKNQRQSAFSSIHLQPWPNYDHKYLLEDEAIVVVQVNGKVRDTIKIQNPKSKIQREVETSARQSEKVKKYLEGRAIKKVIFVPGKLINFVV